MKKILIVFSLINCLLSVNTFAQQNNADSTNNLSNQIENQKNVLSIHPINLVVGGLEVGYERAISSNKSLKFILGYYSSNKPWPYSQDEVSNMEGLKAELQFRSHLDKKMIAGPMSGVYVGAFFQYRQIYLTDYSEGNNISTGSFYTNTSENVFANAVYPGFIFGYQTLVEDLIFVDINLGGGVIRGLTAFEQNKKANITFVNPYINGVVPRFNIALGFPF